jgi:DNA-directed RNA polymerase subunit RPC12/RpoP
MKKCTWCGKEYADTATVCPIDLRPLEDVATSGNGEHRQERQRPPVMEPDRPDQILTASFSCFRCGGGLRIRLPRAEAAFRCPKCRAEFRATKAGDSPLVFVVVPDMSQFTSRASDGSPRRKREIPRDVLIALSAFGLEEAATFDQVRSAYRELVKGYHPDKVAHLGPDLRRLAEAKTKEINSAYRVLETFYAA